MPCLIRCDVAHVIKLMTRWAAFNTAEKRVKQFIIHSVGKVLLVATVEDAMQLLKCIFWTVNSKFVGMTNEGNDCLAQQAQACLRRINATGCLEPSTVQYVESIFCSDENDLHLGDDNGEISDSSIEGESDVNEKEEEVETESGWPVTARNKDNPFYMMVYQLALKCRDEAIENDEGTIPNLHYLPKIVPHIVDLCSYLPLWSGIMCRIVGFGDIPPTTAPIESQFSDLKMRVLKNHDKQMRVDDFVKVHLQSMNGATKLAYSKFLSTNVKEPVPQSRKELENIESGGEIDNTSCQTGAPLEV